MQLTLYTDYTLRVLIYLSRRPQAPVTIAEIAAYYAISRNHLVKVVHNLAVLGYIHTTRGKGGGLRLLLDPEKISVGEIVRKVEPHFDIVECFDSEKNACIIDPICVLKNALFQAKTDFLATLDRYPLAQATRVGAPMPLRFHKTRTVSSK